jgi:hypothetical protein
MEHVYPCGHRIRLPSDPGLRRPFFASASHWCSESKPGERPSRLRAGLARLLARIEGLVRR